MFKLLSMEIIIKCLNLGVGKIIARHSKNSAVQLQIKISKRKFIDRFSRENFPFPFVPISGDQFPSTFLSMAQMTANSPWIMIEPGGILFFGNKRLRK